MCNPLAALSAGSMVLGTGLQMRNARRQQDYQAQQMLRRAQADLRAVQERNAAAAAERQRQQAFEAQGAAAVQQALDQAAPTQAATDADAAAMAAETAALRERVMPMGAPLPGSSAGAPRVVTDETARRRAAAAETEAERDQAYGMLQAFRQAFGVGGDALSRAGAQLGTIGNFRQGSARAAQAEQDAASVQHVDPGRRPQPSLWGDLLVGGGNIGLSYGLNGGWGSGAGSYTAGIPGGYGRLVGGV